MIALGSFFLLEQAFDFRILEQLFDFRLGRYMWPLYIIVPGLLLCGFALTMAGDGGEVLISVGSVVTMTGMLLLYQNTMDHFQSWAYAWALVTPTSVGLGQIVYGSLENRPQTIHRGKQLFAIGIGIFLVGGIFFELVIGISGFGLGRLGRYAWPILLIGLGVFFILRNRVSQARPVQSSPVQSSPVQSSPVQSSPVQSSPVQSPVPTDPTQKLSRIEEEMDPEKMPETMHPELKVEDSLYLLVICVTSATAVERFEPR